MKLRTAFAICSFALLFALLAPPADAVDALSRALGQVDLKPEQLGFDRQDVRYYGGDTHVLPLFEVLYGDPLKVPKYTKSVVDRAGKNPGSLAAALGDLSRRAGSSVRRGLIRKPADELLAALDPEEPMRGAMLRLLDATGQSYSSDYVTKLLGQAQQIPKPAMRHVALLLCAAAQAIEWRDKALLDTAGELTQDLSRKLRLNLGDETEYFDPDLRRLARDFDYDYLLCGAQDLAAVLDQVIGAFPFNELPEETSIQIDTPVGRIEIQGQGASKYDYPGGYLLVVDAGGNDTYLTAGSASPETVPVSLVLDAAGDDRYAGLDQERPGPGGAILGYAFVVDLAGDDAYRGPFLSQGAGVFGVGAVLDKQGSDVYDSVGPSQGAGLFGLGMLLDLQGNDFYHCYFMSQGFGWTRGAGLLLDVSGDDRYVANDKDIRFPASQSDKHNTSLAQGCGFGLRADYTDGHSLAGGVGLLVDLDGNDKYSSGIFGQGAGYWYGIGVLADKAGDDSYQGIWYCQAAAAHFAIGILYDEDGNDSYAAELNMAQGAGHDFSLGFLLEMAGSDTYKAPNLSLGGGNANGIGLFFDWRGNDRYEVKADTTLGRANTASRGSLRDTFPTFGVFMDCGGKDSYSKPFAEDNSRWRQPGVNVEAPLETEIGVGIDGVFDSQPW